MEIFYFGLVRFLKNSILVGNLPKKSLFSKQLGSVTYYQTENTDRKKIIEYFPLYPYLFGYGKNFHLPPFR